MKTITPQELHERYERGESIDLLDVRTPVEYREVHAEYATNAPLDALDPHAVMAARNGNTAQPLYTLGPSEEK